MNKVSNNYKGTIEVEVQCLIPERIINLLWNKGVIIKNVRKVNISTVRFYIAIKDYKYLEESAKVTNSKIRITSRSGIYFFIIKIKKYLGLAIGSVLFLVLIYYMSTFIWSIEIETEKYLSPYEVRKYLMDLGVKPGIKKKDASVAKIEEEMKKREDIMWIRARVEGSKMKIKIAERKSPPIIEEDNSTNNIISKMDGEVIRVYTVSGTALVKPGDLVKKGDILINAEQGKEGATYITKAEGDVMAKTFYEFNKSIKLKGTLKEPTGNMKEEIYISIFGRRLYLKKYNNEYKDFKDIEQGGKIIKKVIYYELKETNFEKDENQVINQSTEELKNQLIKELPIDCKILDNIINKDSTEDVLNLNIIFIVEQNISLK
ncbi:sporulation protein YqfD [Clostridium algidicarnis]|uniref:sporulation protein YqfD n=1 Tax=Clostridium algidicarnis TaxID=37659 RepID=UPI001C0D96A3|nr:sporulation protein YqfD [Clostridium algidicarnis]MBU3195777.1 sporulation protein YqfD [Clostridium algidicarnis]MBU3208799.1 sporulation protein YqfD [Clostridium algidicarnis]MBU3226690.1 sporulation protein YqfD [Clostridium algidicarnis]MBU3250399.1 sporulation protein YqfD [Clostridium algidicarnis]